MLGIFKHTRCNYLPLCCFGFCRNHHLVSSVDPLSKHSVNPLSKHSVKPLSKHSVNPLSQHFVNSPSKHHPFSYSPQNNTPTMSFQSSTVDLNFRRGCSPRSPRPGTRAQEAIGIAMVRADRGNAHIYQAEIKETRAASLVDQVPGK
jgi:hypothetical protein